MADDEYYFMRPVVEGMISYESLLNGTIGLEDIRRMNAALDVKYSNENKYREANSDDS